MQPIFQQVEDVSSGKPSTMDLCSLPTNFLPEKHQLSVEYITNFHKIQVIGLALKKKLSPDNFRSVRIKHLMETLYSSYRKGYKPLEPAIHYKRKQNRNSGGTFP